MKNILLLKQNYQEAFRGFSNKIDKSYYRLFGWFILAAYLVVICVLIFRATTGFAL